MSSPPKPRVLGKTNSVGIKTSSGKGGPRVRLQQSPWDAWEEALSESYEQSVLLVEEKRLAEAKVEFAGGFSQNARSLKDKAATTPPNDFASFGEWPQWVSQLTDRTSAVQQAFDTNDPVRAKQELWKVREHFFALHEQTKTLRTCDVIFAYVRELAKAQPSTEALLKLNTQFEVAEFASRATAEAVEFTQAKSDWTKAVREVAKDNVISSEDRACLLKQAAALYRDFGVQLH